MPLTCVLFDHDETLVSTFALRAAVIEHAARAVLARDVDGAAYLDASHGKSLEQMAVELAAGDGTIADRFVAVYRERYYAENARGVVAYDGIAETLIRLRARGVLLGVVTSKLGRGARGELERCRLIDQIGCVVGAEDVAAPKPAPEPLLMAMRQLGAQAAATLMVGDTPADLLGARAAGVASAAALWGARDPQALLALAPEHAFDDPRAILDLVD